ncbi:glycoside hydrolase family 27 protein [Crepidotus variabilis]|uniref:Alpha-galactosidase n=1 Tax=Crepidotus variabilis TaxID=179855 RepID=A0A9P6JTL1_9AGAR|nr:glycoside hydrolase family 27 protein [Crepidotus variabilis]
MLGCGRDLMRMSRGILDGIRSANVDEWRNSPNFKLEDASAEMSVFGLLKKILPFAIPAFLAPSIFGFDNGEIGRLPPMGFNTWNRFFCDINEQLIHDTATLMKSKGFLDAGYKYINLDDCWLQRDRGADGHLVPDSTKFPSGMKNLTHFLNGLGFKAGIYEDLGTQTCAGFAGSLNHELTDARDFVNWGFEYAKIDNCNSGGYKGSNEQRFKRWSDALTQVHRETGVWMYYSFVEWQGFDAWLWGKNVANTWRMYDDIFDNWPRVVEIVNNASFIGDYTNFYGRNDLDMLENGNGDLTIAEQRSHFTIWALTKSPLLVGTDISKLSQESTDILLNKEIIAINQDNVIGDPVKPFFWGRNPDHTWDPTFPAQYWSGYYGDKKHTVIMYINFNDRTVDLNFTLSRSPHLKGDKTYKVYDLWKHQDVGIAKDFFFGRDVASHDVRAYVFTEQ